MIVVDSSAVVAILLGESTAGALLEVLAGDPARIMSAANYLEAGTVLAARRSRAPEAAIADLDAFLAEAGIDLAPVDAEQARVALRARVRYGRGMGHGGTLNFGDCFAYALARSRAAKLLFVGDDFHTTDVLPAIMQAGRA
ncbi:MAG: type II toxin-antitoxin system VapC family toxin, partial [Rhodospirillales bacterium]